MDDILDAISNMDLTDGESVVINDSYLVECEEIVESIPQSRYAYSSSKSYSKSFYVTQLSVQKKVFTIKQNVTFVINTSMGKAKISSHTVSFIPNVSGYTASVNYISKLNVYNTMVASYTDVNVYSLAGNYYIGISVTVYSSGEYRFNISLR